MAPVAITSATPGNIDLESDPLLDQQITQLQQKITRVKDENKSLREKIEATNAGISSYISEMSTMLDSNDLSMLTGPTLHVSDGQQQMDIMGAKAHAGTGGSSKMRTRPFNNY